MTPWEVCRADELACAQLQMQILRELGVSQVETARHCGIHRSQVNRWARGKQGIPSKYQRTLHLMTGAARKHLADACQMDGGLARLEEVLARLKRVNAFYAQMNALHNQMIANLDAYADEGVVLRELWSIAHATD